MARVSVGLPVYNGENFIEEALDSILSQTYEDFELIISDNASTDRTAEICEDYAAKDRRIRYHRNDKNLGAAANYNRVFEYSTGEYFKWAAHDDVCGRKYLERCVEVLDREPSVVLCCPRIIYIDESGEVLRAQNGDLSVRAKTPDERLRKLVKYQIAGTDIFWTIFGLIRSRALRMTRMIGKYCASDQVLLLELILTGDFYQVLESLYFRREHPFESMKEHLRPKERAAWFDPAKEPWIVLPNWRLLFEHFASVSRAGLTFHTAVSCYHQILRRFASRWRKLGGELKQALLEDVLGTQRS